MSNVDEEFDFDVQGLAELDPFEEARGLNEQDKENQKNARVAIIRTSDRITYRRCRRKWDWSHSSRGNLRAQLEAGPLWLGSGLHFAFEDFHSYKYFEHPRDALVAYYDATELTDLIQPQDKDELLDLGSQMLDYYESWLQTREPLNTLYINGEPQVEVNFHIEIAREHLAKFCPEYILELYDRVLYSITLDRVIEDPYNRLWTVEYKSAKNFLWAHLDTDAQVTAYAWGARLKYAGRDIAGTIYQQHKKQILQPPAFLASTRMFSTSKRQKTSYSLYLNALRNLYGSSSAAFPEPNLMFLEYLKEQETTDADDLIKRDYIERNEEQCNSEYQKILMEVSEMLNPNLNLYPNPTRDCSWDCPFNSACIGLDAGEDWSHQLQSATTKRDTDATNWRQFLVLPAPQSDSKVY